QHQLRAHTPNAAKALRATVSTYPRSGYDLEQVLQQLGTGEAVVTVMNPDGAPTPVAWTRIWAPESTMGPTDAEALRAGVAQSQLMARYGQAVDRDSAHEMLIRKVEGGARAADEQARAEAERQEAEARRKESGPTSRSRSTGPSRSRKEPGLVEQVTGSTAFKQFARTAAREIVRSLFGTGRRR